MTRREQFKTRCNDAAMKCGIRHVLYSEDAPHEEDDVFRDADGLHIRKEGYRARFDICHNLNDKGVWPGSWGPMLNENGQDAKIRAVLETLGMREWLSVRRVIPPVLD